MTITGDAASTKLTDTWQTLVATVSGGWSQREAGVIAAVTTVPVPYLNGAFAEGGADADAVASLLDQIADSGVPHFLQLRPGCTRSLAELAVRRGMTRDEDVPLMALEDPSGLSDGQADGLVIRALSPEDVSRHARLAAAGFEAPEEYFLQLMTPETLNLPGARCYVGEVDGESVTTGYAITLGDAVGIFNIATPPVHRRHGYGASVTAHAVREGLRSGARWAWLQSSPAGYPVYQRLGFRTVESWQCWLSTRI